MPSAEQNAIVQEQMVKLHDLHMGLGEERVASYYPPEMSSEAHRFGIAFTHVDGTQWHYGDCEFSFPLHSISKVFIHALALEDNGRDEVLRRVGVEPSGDPFNSVSFDEENNRPFNPMINAGALVATSLVRGRDHEERVERLLELLRTFSGNPGLAVDEQVLAAEIESNDRNRALGYLMRSLDMIHGDVEENLATYLSICAVRVTGRELADMGATLAFGGRNPITGDQALTPTYLRDVITVMMTCGMYTAAGEWAYDVGIPAKSAVSGGLLVSVPGSFGGGFFSPGLDRHGNSVRAVNMCRDLSSRFGLHAYADPGEAQFGRDEPVGSSR